MDAIPVFSQAKSLIQWMFRDAEGAMQTQVNFSRQCPVVSQVRSMVESANGDKSAALETQMQFVNFLGCIVDGIPVVGHLKGTVHYVCGNKEGGAASMKAASRTSAVIGGGVGGFVLGGPVGAVTGGITAGAAIDSIITSAGSAVNKTFVPYGIFEPIADPTNPGKWCDAAGGIVLDGIAGRCAGKVVQQVQLKKISKASGVLDSIRETAVTEGFIPRPLVPFIGKIKLILMLGSQKIVFQVLAAGQKRLEKELSKVPTFDEKHCKLDMRDEKVVDKSGDAKDLGSLRFQQNGDVVEFYCQEKLILVKNGDLTLIVNGEGGMERIKDGVKYCLCNNGTFVKMSALKHEMNAALEGHLQGDEYEDASSKWFDAEPVQKFIKFEYDIEQKKILWDTPAQQLNAEEEHQGLSAPAQRRSMMTV